jgi:uncharacterized paraquat-inducible protein A
MISYNCPKCQAPMQADDNAVGSMGTCPRCQSPVQVPAKKNIALILGIVGGLAVVSCCMCGLVSLAMIQILGQNANSAFGTVGASIGSTVTST